MVSERRIFCLRLRYPFKVGINLEEKYRLMQERKKEIKAIMKDTLFYVLTYWYPVYLPTTAAAELAYLILDFLSMNLIYYNYAL